MILTDSIYGQFTVETIVEELIATKEFQRLKDIHQGGASYLVNPLWNISRYEHSVGTMLLIRLLGGSIEEQIAGLLHDLSHTAFSHVVDFALQNNEEDYHEKIYESIIHASAIPEILKKHGFDADDILFNESKWTILEQPSPKLCADRIDYTLRDMYHYFNLSLDEITLFLNHLTVVEGEIVVTSIQMSEWFIALYYQEVVDFFMHPLNIYAYHQLAAAMSLALEKNLMTLADLLKTDHQLLTQLKHLNEPSILTILDQLHPQVHVMEDKINYDLHQKNKLRLIDPTLYLNHTLTKTSAVSSHAITLTQRASEKLAAGVYLKVMST